MDQGVLRHEHARRPPPGGEEGHDAHAGQQPAVAGDEIVEALPLDPGIGPRRGRDEAQGHPHALGRHLREGRGGRVGQALARRQGDLHQKVVALDQPGHRRPALDDRLAQHRAPFLPGRGGQGADLRFGGRHRGLVGEGRSLRGLDLRRGDGRRPEALQAPGRIHRHLRPGAGGLQGGHRARIAVGQLRDAGEVEDAAEGGRLPRMRQGPPDLRDDADPGALRLGQMHDGAAILDRRARSRKPGLRGAPPAGHDRLEGLPQAGQRCGESGGALPRLRHGQGAGRQDGEQRSGEQDPTCLAHLDPP